MHNAQQRSDTCSPFGACSAAIKRHRRWSLEAQLMLQARCMLLVLLIGCLAACAGPRLGCCTAVGCQCCCSCSSGAPQCVGCGRHALLHPSKTITEPDATSHAVMPCACCKACPSRWAAEQLLAASAAAFSVAVRKSVLGVDGRLFCIQPQWIACKLCHSCICSMVAAGPSTTTVAAEPIDYN